MSKEWKNQKWNSSKVYKSVNVKSGWEKEDRMKDRENVEWKDKEMKNERVKQRIKYRKEYKKI